eukprot:TRINITY_DN3036_c0_g2_i2.p1 TRINITY_DN3036_c0_g2~~TRINITY_DN3036_c0_g2_i2.p1  ORF type:complete len:416 (+),score=82.22 TRINITY_DN3036_c0_g2_i2:100-1248(+)
MASTTTILPLTPSTKQIASAHIFCVYQQLAAVTFYILGKNIFTYIPSGVFLILRIGFLLPFFYPMAKIVGGRFFPQKNQIPLIMLCGFIFIVLNQNLLFGGLKFSSSINASIISAPCTPMFTALFSVLAGTDKMTISKAIGFAATIGGALVLLEVENFSFEGKTLGNLLLVGASLCSALISLVQKKLMIKGVHPFVLQANTCCFGLILYCIIMVPFGIYKPEQWVGLRLPSVWISTFIIVILGTAIPWIIGMYALKYTSPMTANIYVVLQPVIGSFVGVFLLDELFTLRQILGTCLVLTGLLLVNANPIMQRCIAAIRGRPMRNDGFIVLPTDEKEESDDIIGTEMKPIPVISDDGADQGTVISIEQISQTSTETETGPSSN